MDLPRSPLNGAVSSRMGVAPAAELGLGLRYGVRGDVCCGNLGLMERRNLANFRYAVLNGIARDGSASCTVLRTKSIGWQCGGCPAFLVIVAAA